MPSAKVTVGNVEIVSLLDTPMEFDWKMFFPKNDPSDFEPYRQQYPGSFGEGKFRTYCHCYALRSQGRTILCDTGLGPGPIAFLGGIRGRLLEDMRSKGVQPEDVDMVVFTHLHGDHVGWNLSPDHVPNFGKARYLVPQADWDFFSQNAASNPQMGQVTPLKELGLLDLFSGERALTSEVTAIPTPGHTPGHTSLLISSGGEKAIITGDLAHHPAQVERSDWSSAFDGDPPKAVESRKKVFDQLESEGSLAVICHFPDPGFGRLARVQGKRVFQAL
ncbi:MAG TPA: MBL fold metallo-hydrolase [Dehalococcoidia bacterium]|nr:MBL fold metallo-hydrolase [Dehalococcoidia bacterium]